MIFESFNDNNSDQDHLSHEPEIKVSPGAINYVKPKPSVDFTPGAVHFPNNAAPDEVVISDEPNGCRGVIFAFIFMIAFLVVCAFAYQMLVWILVWLNQIVA